jgi:hypothetical protein
MKWISFLASQRFHSLPAGDFISCQPAISFLATGDFIPCQPVIFHFTSCLGQCFTYFGVFGVVMGSFSNA